MGVAKKGKGRQAPRTSSWENRKLASRYLPGYEEWQEEVSDECPLADYVGAGVMGVSAMVAVISVFCREIARAEIWEWFPDANIFQLTCIGSLVVVFVALLLSLGLRYIKNSKLSKEYTDRAVCLNELESALLHDGFSVNGRGANPSDEAYQNLIARSIELANDEISDREERIRRMQELIKVVIVAVAATLVAAWIGSGGIDFNQLLTGMVTVVFITLCFNTAPELFDDLTHGSYDTLANLIFYRNALLEIQLRESCKRAEPSGGSEPSGDAERAPS